MPDAQAGLFVSVEGIDGSGKSTQARLLAEHLRAAGETVTLTREPGGSPGAEEIRRLVLQGDPDRWSPETEILLFTAARRDHLERTIRPALARGEVVITDRFADSTRVYQGLTRGDLTATVDRLHDLMIGVEPDLTLLIDMEARAALARSLDRLSTDLAPILGDRDRLPEDRFEAFGGLFQEKLRQGFLALADRNAARCVVIDGNRAPDEVARDVARVTLSRLATPRSMPA
jgi:dTMP kinase